MRYQIGVVGSAIETDENIKEKARKVGQAIAEYDCTLITGGCGGLPYEAAKGANLECGTVIGVSPASNLREHVNVYKMPEKEYSSLIFTGFGKKGRTVPLARSCDALIAISGRTGTMVELGIAYDENRLIGLLSGVPGVSGYFDEWVGKLGKPGGKIIKNENPETLVKEVVEYLKKSK